jgi:hypothetical protein
MMKRNHVLDPHPERRPAAGVLGLADPLPASGLPRTMRASDEDRRRVTDLLQAHFVAGRLDGAELEQRVGQALAARTLAELDALLADLPPVDAAPSDREAPRQQHGKWSHGRHHHGHEKSFRSHAASYFLVMTFLVTIWLLTTPGGYFWPIWPMLGWGLGLAAHGLACRR